MHRAYVSFSSDHVPGSRRRSVLALQKHIADKYVVGLYGNTMTTNPRALDIARDVLTHVTPAVRANILARGTEFQQVFGALVKKHPHLLTKVTGSGMIQVFVVGGVGLGLGLGRIVWG